MSKVRPLSHDHKTVDQAMEFINDLYQRGELLGISVVIDHRDEEARPARRRHRGIERSVLGQPMLDKISRRMR